MKFTGERVVLGEMPGRMEVIQEHLTRYTFALGILESFRAKYVLDAACGTGYGTWLMQQSGFNVTGVDIDAQALKEAIKLNRNNMTSFARQSLDEVDYTFLRGCRFDAIVSFETIEHLEKPDRFIEWAKERSDTFIFSLPIKQPSEFHKQVYTADEAVQQIKKHYNNSRFYIQTGMDIMEWGQQQEEPGGYIIGYARSV